MIVVIADQPYKTEVEQNSLPPGIVLTPSHRRPSFFLRHAPSIFILPHDRTVSHQHVSDHPAICYHRD
jgi:hypothetical protein